MHNLHDIRNMAKHFSGDGDVGGVIEAFIVVSFCRLHDFFHCAEEKWENGFQVVLMPPLCPRTLERRINWGRSMHLPACFNATRQKFDGGRERREEARRHMTLRPQAFKRFRPHWNTRFTF